MPSLDQCKADDLVYNYIPKTNYLQRVTDGVLGILNFKGGTDDAEEYVYGGQGNLIRDK